MIKVNSKLRQLSSRVIRRVVRKSLTKSSLPPKKSVHCCLMHEKYRQCVKNAVLDCGLVAEGYYVDASHKLTSGRVSNVAKYWVVQPVYWYSLHNVCVNINSGLIYFPDGGEYCEEFSTGWGRFRTNKTSSISGKAVVPCGEVVFPFTGMGYHGFLEDLSHALWLRERGIRFTVLIRKDNQWMINLLQFFGFCSKEIEAFSGKHWLGPIRECFVISKAPLSEFIHRDLVGLVCSRRFQEVGTSRIFISRADGNRKLDFDEEVALEHFKKRGFKVVVNGNYSVKEQAALYRSAGVVAGSHGAGFCNLVFCGLGTRVIELYGHRHYNSCYSTLCYELGLEYSNIDGVLSFSSGSM